MTKPIPSLQKFMTTTPLFINKDAPLLDAAKMMQTNQIRHLPVMYNNKVEGILSETDINLIRGLKFANMETLRVLDCYSPNAYCVSPNSRLDDVLNAMAEHKYGCVVVTDHEKLVGIFTWIDALKAASELLHTRLKD